MNGDIIMSFNDLFQAAEWKNEKHSPAIVVKKKEDKDFIFIKVSVGKEIAHPNQTGHHIRWINFLCALKGSCRMSGFIL